MRYCSTLDESSVRGEKVEGLPTRPERERYHFFYQGPHDLRFRLAASSRSGSHEHLHNWFMRSGGLTA